MSKPPDRKEVFSKSMSVSMKTPLSSLNQGRKVKSKALGERGSQCQEAMKGEAEFPGSQLALLSTQACGRGQGVRRFLPRGAGQRLRLNVCLIHLGVEDQQRIPPLLPHRDLGLSHHLSCLGGVSFSSLLVTPGVCTNGDENRPTC